jgi:hypothetical protein
MSGGHAGMGKHARVRLALLLCPPSDAVHDGRDQWVRCWPTALLSLSSAVSNPAEAPHAVGPQAPQQVRAHFLSSLRQVSSDSPTRKRLELFGLPRRRATSERERSSASESVGGL